MIYAPPCTFLQHPRDFLKYQGNSRYLACFSDRNDECVVDDGKSIYRVAFNFLESIRITHYDWLSKNPEIDLQKHCLVVDLRNASLGLEWVTLWIMEKDLALHLAHTQSIPEGMEIRSWGGYSIYAM